MEGWRYINELIWMNEAGLSKEWEVKILQIHLILNIYWGLSLEDKIEPYLEGRKNVNIVLEEENWKVSGLENKGEKNKFPVVWDRRWQDRGQQCPVGTVEPLLDAIHVSFWSRKISRENTEARKLANPIIPDRFQYFLVGSIWLVSGRSRIWGQILDTVHRSRKKWMTVNVSTNCYASNE